MANVSAVIVAESLGGLDILVNNAAIARGVPFEDIGARDPDTWDWTMQHNLRGPWALARAAAPHPLRSGSGRIVNVAAMAGLRPMGASIAQSVSKAGVIQLTRCLALALAPDVSANCVAPGLMEGTELTRNLSAAFRDGFTSRAALGATTSLADVATQVVRFCEADTITGQTLVTDGAIHFH
jgi:3-oxoacyl-[acyl-carrier protein] reductase